MAKEESKSFPMFSEKTWFSLRKKFQHSVPSLVNDAYLSSAIDVKPRSAQVFISHLKSLLIIDGEGKPTDIALEWRTDDKYKIACHKILNSVYPKELIESQPPQNYEINSVVNWFFNKGVGKKTAKSQANVYKYLCDADLSKVDEIFARKSNKDRTIKVTKKEDKIINSDKINKSIDSNAQIPNQQPSVSSNEGIKNIENRFIPKIHIDVQVHISPESTPEQIDHIFESMSKHLFKNIK